MQQLFKKRFECTTRQLLNKRKYKLYEGSHANSNHSSGYKGWTRDEVVHP